MSDLPAPLVPFDVDVSDMEPPWDAFVDLAVATFGVDRKVAQAAVDHARAQ